MEWFILSRIVTLVLLAVIVTHEEQIIAKFFTYFLEILSCQFFCIFLRLFTSYSQLLVYNYHFNFLLFDISISWVTLKLSIEFKLITSTHNSNWYHLAAFIIYRTIFHWKAWLINFFFFFKWLVWNILLLNNFLYFSLSIFTLRSQKEEYYFTTSKSEIYKMTNIEQNITKYETGKWGKTTGKDMADFPANITN